MHTFVTRDIDTAEHERSEVVRKEVVEKEREGPRGQVSCVVCDFSQLVADGPISGCFGLVIKKAGATVLLGSKFFTNVRGNMIKIIHLERNDFDCL